MKKKKKKKIREVVFWDIVKNVKFILQSTVETNDTAIIDGKVFPLFKVETSSQSHPAYTGEKSNLDILDKVAKFKKKYNRK